MLVTAGTPALPTRGMSNSLPKTTTVPVVTVWWKGTVTALSSITHGGLSRGTITLLRREVLVRDGKLVEVPVISGNAWRGRLRRTGEELTRQVLRYEGQIPLAAAHALRGGGSLVKRTGEPLSGSRLQRARFLLPQLAVFGGAAGRTIDGALMVGKLLPQVAETDHLTGRKGSLSAFQLVQLEEFTRVDESATAATAALLPPPEAEQPEDALEAAGSVVYGIETFPAGATFSTWLSLERVHPVAAAFFTEVLTTWSTTGRLGGRGASGHGRVTTNLTCIGADQDLPDWRAHLVEHREEILDVIRSLA